MQRRAPRGLPILVLALVISIVVCGLVVTLAITSFLSELIQSRLEFYSLVIAALSFVLGTAATVAGAVATVILATAALTLSQREENREASAFLQERLTEAVRLFTDVCISLTGVF